jgi:FkbM family methyltransferase
MNQILPDDELLITGINRLKKTRHGMILYNPNDLYVGKSFDLYGEYSEGEITLFRQLIRPGAIILDIGANIGPHALFYAQCTGPSGILMAFEPQRILFQMLCANMALNGVANSFCYNAAVGASSGTVIVPALDYGIENNFGGLSLTADYSGHGEQTVILPIDSLKLQQCHFIKIDVEGMELEVLTGAQETINRCRPLIYLENDRKEKSPPLIKYLQAMDYNLFWHCPNLFNPDNYFRNMMNIFDGIVSINMLCIPSGLTLDIKGLKAVNGEDDWFI